MPEFDMSQSAMIKEMVVALPVLNEGDTIAGTLADLRADMPGVQIWVFDGGSRDNTRDGVLAMMQRDNALHLFDNPERTQAHAINRAACLAAAGRYRILVRADAHMRYLPGYGPGLAALVSHMNADSVTVPLLADLPSDEAGGEMAGKSSGDIGKWQRANTALQQSVLGHGGAAHRKTGGSGWVDHGHHAAFRLDRFLDIGGYDTRLRAAEDVDYDRRLRASGGKIWCAGEWSVRYLPRATPGAVWAQMWRNGRARAQLCILARIVPGLRQILPVGAAVAVACVPLGAVHGAFMVPGAVYGAGVVLGGGVAASGGAARRDIRIWPCICALAVVSHLGFGFGFLTEIFGTLGAKMFRRFSEPPKPPTGPKAIPIAHAILSGVNNNDTAQSFCDVRPKGRINAARALAQQSPGDRAIAGERAKSFLGS